MTDRELLERAAKAAEIAGEYDNLFGGVVYEFGQVGFIWDDQPEVWNPLTDDGDALRLAVKLSLTVKVYGNHTWVKGFNSSCCHDDSCPYAATRRAIVRAAAEIGKGTK